MFDLGMQELIVIFTVALIVFGPKRLPELSRALGKGIRELKTAMRGAKEAIEETDEQIEEKIYKEIYPSTSIKQKTDKDPEQSAGEQRSDEKPEQPDNKTRK